MAAPLCILYTLYLQSVLGSRYLFSPAPSSRLPLKSLGSSLPGSVFRGFYQHRLPLNRLTGSDSGSLYFFYRLWLPLKRLRLPNTACSIHYTYSIHSSTNIQLYIHLLIKYASNRWKI